MKLLVHEGTDEILFLADDIEELGPANDANNNNIYELKYNDKDSIFHHGKCYIYDTGDDPIINQELLEADIPGNYCIEDGNIVMKAAYSLSEIKKVKRDTAKLINMLEVGQLNLLYEMSLLQLGFK